MKYSANFSANNGTTLMQPIESNNLKQLLKDIKEIAEGERFAGNTASYWVDNAETGEVIESRMIDSNGIIHKTNY